MKLTKAQALAEVREIIRDNAQEFRDDSTAKRELWNNITDSMRRDSRITEQQYSTWSNPF